MTKLKESIAVEYSAGLLKVLACSGETLPVEVSFSFLFSFNEKGVKIFLWPVDHELDMNLPVNIKFQGKYGVTYPCELTIKVDVNGYAEFILCPKGVCSVKYTPIIDVGEKVDFSGDADVMEKMYHYLYISNNALKVYTRFLNRKKVIEGLSDFEMQELRYLTEKLHCSIRKKNIPEAKKILSLLSEWDFKLSCI